MNNQNNNLNNIQGAIVKTIAFFDLFDFPMTDFEVWQNINFECSYEEVREELDKENKMLKMKNGFWFLSGRAEIIETRMRRYNYTDKKFKRALKVSRLFRYIPWIKMIGIGNIIGAHNLKKDGDIDFFIVTEKNRIWISRFFCVLITKFLRLRPTENDTKDKICLSFFIDEDNMDMKKLMLSSGIDYYFVYWLAGLVPIYEKGDIYSKIIKNNEWLRVILPNWNKKHVHHVREVKSKNSIFYRDVFDMLVGGLEKYFKKLSLKKFPQSIKEIMNKDGRVVISDHVLKLHVNDRREEFSKKFNSKLKKLNIQ